MIVVLQEGCKLVKKESRTHEENRLLERIIPKDGFNFIIGKRNFQNKLVDDPDCFPCFFHAEIIALQRKNVIEKPLISTIPGFHVQKLHFGFHREQPTGKLLGFLIFSGIIKNFPVLIVIFQNFIGISCTDFNISGQTYCQFAACLVGWYSAVLEQKMLAPACAVHSTGQRIFFYNLEQYFGRFKIIHINQNCFRCQNSSVFRQ